MIVDMEYVYLEMINLLFYALNRDSAFVLSYSPFTPKQRCAFWNSTSYLFVYSVHVISNRVNNTSNQLFRFIQLAEDMLTQNVYISLITLNRCYSVHF
jgi:hypothetical protein